MKFEHLTFTKEQVEKQKLEVLTIRSVLNLLKKIHKDMMKKHGHNYCPNAVWRDMQEKCIIFSNDTKILVFKKRFDKMIKIYEGNRNCDYMAFYHIKDFNPLIAMFVRNQVSEC